MPRFAVEDGEIFYEDVGRGEPLLLVHGAASSGKGYMSGCARGFAEKYRLLIVDLRGMGQSCRVRGAMRPDAWVTDCIHLLDHAGIDRVHLIGESLGARIAGRIAASVPERVISLTVLNPIVRNEAAGNASLNALLGQEISENSAEGERYRMMHGSDWRDVVAKYMQIRNQPDVQEYLALDSHFVNLTMPTLLVRNDDLEDRTHPFMHAIQWHQEVPSSWLWVVPRAPMAILEENLDEFNVVFERFMGHVLTTEGTVGEGR